MSNNFTIKFETVATQQNNALKRLVGFVKAKSLIRLITITDLESNPRAPRVGAITEAIWGSLEDDKSTFPFMTKGILLASSSVVDRDRNRYELSFVDSHAEGVLDGGHNLLALALYMLKKSCGEDAIKGIKLWKDLQSKWEKNHANLEANKESFDFLVPVEIVVPISDDQLDIDKFNSSIHQICAARNNNAPLRLETKAHQKGHYDTLKKCLDSSINKIIQWKTNDVGRIKSPDIIALSWVALSKVELPEGVSAPVANNFNSQKNEYVKAFDSLMGNAEVGSSPDGKKYELHNTAISNALSLMKDMPRLQDLIYKEFYEKYSGTFGRIGSVKKYEKGKKPTKDTYLTNEPKTKYYQQAAKYKYSEGFIMPLVYALRVLIKQDGDKVDWLTNPDDFVVNNFATIMESYKEVLKELNYDPAKVGKSKLAYITAEASYKECLLDLREIANAA